MNFLVAQIISCYNPFETKERNLIKIYPFETKERNLIKIYSFEKGIHMKAISKMKSLILKYRHAWVLLYGLIYMPWFCYLEKRQTIHYLIHSPLDDYIPFVEYFIIPYLLWFVFLAVTGADFFFTNRRDFYRLAAFLCSGMTIFLKCHMLLSFNFSSIIIFFISKNKPNFLYDSFIQKVRLVS